MTTWYKAQTGPVKGNWIYEKASRSLFQRETTLFENCKLQGMQELEIIPGYADLCHRGRIAYPVYPLATWLQGSGWGNYFE